jgi:hypothetical protein
MTQEPAPPAPDDPAAARPQADDDDELLIAGQEEVFSRAEVERGAIEHHAREEDLRPTPVDPDEAMAENFRATFDPRP